MKESARDEIFRCVLRPMGYAFCILGWCWFLFAMWLRYVDATTFTTNEPELVKAINAAFEAYEQPKQKEGFRFYLILNPKSNSDA